MFDFFQAIVFLYKYLRIWLEGVPNKCFNFNSLYLENKALANTCSLELFALFWIEKKTRREIFPSLLSLQL